MEIEIFSASWECVVLLTNNDESTNYLFKVYSHFMSFVEKICTVTFLRNRDRELSGAWGIPRVGTAFFWGETEGNIVLNIGDLSKYHIYPGLRVDLESLLWKVRIWLGAKHGKTRGSYCKWKDNSCTESLLQAFTTDLLNFEIVLNTMWSPALCSAIESLCW